MKGAVGVAAWRLKACDLFGARAGAFSFNRGVVEVADALYDTLAVAIREENEALAGRVFEYALWADANTNAEHLRSAVDIRFFMRLFDDPEMKASAVKHLPADVIRGKWKMAVGIVEDEEGWIWEIGRRKSE